MFFEFQPISFDFAKVLLTINDKIIYKIYKKTVENFLLYLRIFIEFNNVKAISK